MAQAYSTNGGSKTYTQFFILKPVIGHLEEWGVGVMIILMYLRREIRCEDVNWTA
jgi:hypothetical protein